MSGCPVPQGKNPDDCGVAMPNSEEEKALQRYQLAVGKVVFSWNNMQESLILLYVRISDCGEKEGFETWNSIKNDGAQRKLIRDAAAARGSAFWKAKGEKAEDDIKWLLDQIAELQELRNQVVHASFKIHRTNGKSPTVEAFPYLGNPRSKQLQGKDILEQCAYCEVRAQLLMLYAYDLLAPVALAQCPWPSKPNLPPPEASQRPNTKSTHF